MNVMWRKGAAIFLALVLLLPAQAEALDLGKAAVFGLGFVSGIYFHEFGHALVAVSQGGTVEEIGFAYTGVRFHGTTEEVRSKFRITDLGGYAAQTLISEIIIRNRDWHQNDFALGLMTFGIFNNINNLVRYYLLADRSSMDLSAYERQGGNPAIPAVLMGLHATFSLYRIFNQTAIVPYIGSNILGFSTTF